MTKYYIHHAFIYFNIGGGGQITQGRSKSDNIVSIDDKLTEKYIFNYILDLCSKPVVKFHLHLFREKSFNGE